MRIAMWSGPRNLSTAMMYSFGARADFTAMDEPFYAAYLAQSGRAHPMRDAILAAGEADLNVSVQPKNEWDVCAGDLLVREAGGHMVDLNGVVRRYNQPDPLIRGGLAAANPGLADLMVALVSDVAS